MKILVKHVHIFVPYVNADFSLGLQKMKRRASCTVPDSSGGGDCFAPWRTVMIVAGWIPRREDDSETRIIQSSAVLTNGV